MTHDCHTCAKDGPDRADGRPYRGGGCGVFLDTRTGYAYCHFHTEALVQWEQDYPDEYQDPDMFDEPDDPFLDDKIDRLKEARREERGI